MTGAMDLQQFTAALNDMALGIGSKPMDHTRVLSYWDELSEFEIADVVAAIRLAKRESTRFVPSVGVIRGMVRRTQSGGATEATPEVIAAVQHGDRHCRVCEDTGWRIVERDVPDGMQGRYKAGATRSYASVCGCRATNPLYQYKRAMEQRKVSAGDER